MDNIFNNLYTTIFFISFLTLFLTYNKRKLRIENATSFILLYLSVTTLFSIAYYNASNGVYRDYSNLTLPPFIYLFVAYIIIIYPIYYNDKQNHKELHIKPNKIFYTEILIWFIIICCIIPFLESIIKLPSSITESDSMALMYEQRLSGKNNEYLSFLGRKFFYFLWRLNNLIPLLLMYATIKKLDKKIIIGLAFSLITIWLHSMILGGRSKLVQNALYVIFIYYVFYSHIPLNYRANITKYGLILISVAFLGTIGVTISRFSQNTSSIDSIWEWVGLYSGEGALNFNSMAWDVKSSTHGYSTFGFPLGILDGKFLSVDEMWNIRSKLQIPGNIFYTFMGSFVFDFGIIGGISILIIITIIFINIYKKCNTFKRLCLISLWGKIAIIGPIFYTYSTIDDQINLLVSLLLIYLL